MSAQCLFDCNVTGGGVSLSPCAVIFPKKLFPIWGRAFPFNLWRPTSEWRPTGKTTPPVTRSASHHLQTSVDLDGVSYKVPGPRKVNGSESSTLKLRQCARAIQRKAYSAVNPAANRP